MMHLMSIDGTIKIQDMKHSAGLATTRHTSLAVVEQELKSPYEVCVCSHLSCLSRPKQKFQSINSPAVYLMGYRLENAALVLKAPHQPGMPRQTTFSILDPASSRISGRQNSHVCLACIFGMARWQRKQQQE